MGNRVPPEPGPAWPYGMGGASAHSLEVGDYERQYRGRSDALYRAKPGGGFKRLWPDYHPGQDEFWKDVRSPVLVFDPDATWYFGREPYMPSI
jgi:hypothetical protein